jgi:molecular chaperone DnaJ
VPTHYDTLGVRRDASADEIRSAYRAIARRVHPDAQPGNASVGSAKGPDMAALNEAWRVLSDPGRRALYDAALRDAASGSRTQSTGSAVPPSTRRAPDPPAGVNIGGAGRDDRRFPKWPFVLLFVLAVIFIVTAGALYQPEEPEGPDNWLVPGSCVAVQTNRDAVEVGCGGPHDATVVTVVGFDSACPTDTETYRDRQGRGYACVRPAP